MQVGPYSKEFVYSNEQVKVRGKSKLLKIAHSLEALVTPLLCRPVSLKDAEAAARETIENVMGASKRRRTALAWLLHWSIAQGKSSNWAIDRASERSSVLPLRL